MLIAKNIYKSYEGLEVLKGINLNIPKSSITSIIGKSGSGKSTLLHILGSLDDPDKGEVMIDGQNLSKMTKKEISLFRNQKIGFVFQFHHLISEFTALENVCIPALINKVSKSEATQKAEKLLNYLGIFDRKEHKPSEMSGGEQQRVAMARALINDPAIVFADEPTGNLDTQTSAELHEMLVNLKNDFGQTFVIVTHNNELSSLSDRCLEIVDGIIKSDMT